METIDNPANLPVKEFREWAAEVMRAKESERIGMVISYPEDLRQSIKMKIFSASPKAKWTAFVNNTGTLVHVVSPEGALLIRKKLTYPIKHLSNWKMLKVIQNLVGPYIRID